MKKYLGRILLVTYASFLSGNAFATDGLAVNLGLFYFSHTSGAHEGQNDVEETDTTTFYTLGACYRFTGGFCGGLKYTAGEAKTESETSTNGVSATSTEKTNTWNGIGASIGYAGQEFSVIGTYFIDPKRTDKNSSVSSSTTEVYSGGMAYQIDLGWGFKVKSFQIGPMLSIVHFDYKKYKADGADEVDLDATLKDDFMIPAFAMWLNF